MENVCVLMSTYNGEKYLREQLDSILASEDVELTILIRDDGSTDGTLQILDEYAGMYSDSKSFPYIKVIKGENLGATASFMELIRVAPKAPYYAFSDQDDVWDPDKLSIAVASLSCEMKSLPLLYHSALRLTDENLKVVRTIQAIQHSSKYQSLIENSVTGCSVVFNRTALLYVQKRMPEYCSVHDVWMYIVCMFFGQVIYDDVSHVSYRQHGDNVTEHYINEHDPMQHVKRIKRILNRSYQPRYNNARSFYKCYRSILSEKDRDVLRRIVYYKRSVANTLALFFDGQLRGNSFMGNVRYRLSILIRHI